MATDATAAERRMIMRAKGYKCSNVKCDRCAWHSMCGELGDAALNCVDRIITIQTNADHIRAMSVAELNDFLRKVADHDDDCPYEYGSVKSLEWLGKPYVQKEYKKL